MGYHRGHNRLLAGEICLSIQPLELWRLTFSLVILAFLKWVFRERFRGRCSRQGITKEGDLIKHYSAGKHYKENRRKGMTRDSLHPLCQIVSLHYPIWSSPQDRKCPSFPLDRWEHWSTEKLCNQGRMNRYCNIILSDLNIHLLFWTLIVYGS